MFPALTERTPRTAASEKVMLAPTRDRLPKTVSLSKAPKLTFPLLAAMVKVGSVPPAKLTLPTTVVATEGMNWRPAPPMVMSPLLATRFPPMRTIPLGRLSVST